MIGIVTRMGKVLLWSVGSGTIESPASLECATSSRGLGGLRGEGPCSTFAR
jgi:hypothetical protein